MTSPQVLIVGAGPVGLTTALALHQAGVPASAILVADVRPSRDLTHNWSKGLTFSASSLEIFRTLGIATRFLEDATAVPNAHFGALRRLLDLNYDVLGTKYPFNCTFPQVKTEAVLIKRCEEVGIPFAWGRKFVGLEQKADVVSAIFERHGSDNNDDNGDNDVETVETSWLVGCDGTHSAVRKAARISWPGTQATRYGWLADCTVQDKTPGIRTAMVQGEKMLMQTISPGVVRYMGLIPPSAATDPVQRPAPPDKDLIRKWADRCFGTDYGLQDVGWSSVTGNGMYHADTYRWGRIFLAGDAAHQLFPAGGQGMNTGLLDAANLAWKLAAVVGGGISGQEEVVERVLDSYTRERRPAVQAVIKNIKVQMALFFATTEQEQAMVDFVTEAFDQPTFNRLWARRVTGFDDPTEPYHLGDEGPQTRHRLVGTRLTHVSDEHAPDILEAARKNVFVLAFVYLITST
ncbi:hypothetical protein M406DRAFT_72668 [Cryphonectria parasitica EP155]|uniref:FAD-binding domain-containing protein n=1 Tax=Cryphonectria parasitica (strain ATCC 38755 / EP155) TaxID=660469 RepID=A0A9P4XXN8_CRYP1|nr:uncharacterized protein M406DRAFT_72668 [Cryphonectria parasitica EP155]KAF3762687.1 hypothetical protein M406DRAFT_72668 [Cryphonectria parasitica EP155]